MLAQFTENGIDTKHALLTLIKNLLVFWCSECLQITILHVFFFKIEVSVIKKRRDTLSDIKCNQKVAGRFTFDLFTQKSLCGFLFPLIFWTWSKKLKNYRDLELEHWEKMVHLWVIVTLSLAKFTCFSIQVFLLWYYTNTILLYIRTDWITKQLEHDLEKGFEHRLEITRGQQRVYNRNDVRFTWSRLKNYCIFPLQYDFKRIDEKPSSKENLNEGSTYSLLICYFVNLPHIRNVGLYHFIPGVGKPQIGPHLLRNTVK